MIIPTRLPAPLSQRLSGTSYAVLKLGGKEVDIAVGGIPFLLATSADLPQSIDTIQQRKEQIDTEGEPGEAALASSWWRRSQASFHEGAGNVFQEDRNEAAVSEGFFDSRGVDPWTLGEFKLLRRMDEVTAPGTGHSWIRTYTDGGVEKVSAITSTALRTGTTPANLANLHAPASKTMVDGFVAAPNFYDLASDGTLYEGTIASPGTATSWPLGTGATRIAFGHHRLWALGGRKLWQPDLSLAGGTAQNPIFTHPNQGWNYTCMAAGPQAMYFGGHDGRSSSIQAITFNDSGGVPALTGATAVATLPDGELIQEISILAGQFIGIGTTKGFRVGVLDGINMTYGPILFAPDGTTNCRSLSTSGTFFLVGFQTASQPAEVYKVDTARQISDGIFPYARDIECATTGHITSTAQWGDKTLATDNAGKVWEQHATELVTSGYLQTGRIRYRTQERKLFKYVELDTDPLWGSVVIEGISETGSTVQVATVSSAAHNSGTAAIGITSALGPQRQMAFKFSLTPDSGDPTQGPVIRSYLIRALPSVRPQRLITLPLLCFDREQGHSGMRYGYEGYASDRLAALQAIEDVGDVLIYQNFGLRDHTGEIVVIDSMRFVQTSPGHRRENSSGRGGILVLQLRTASA